MEGRYDESHSMIEFTRKRFRGFTIEKIYDLEDTNQIYRTLSKRPGGVLNLEDVAWIYRK